jgi:YjbE family integral membrane protein
MEFSANFDVIGPILQICLIDLLLSGDNAILIALACRELPADVRRSAVWLGTGAAVGFRVLLTFAATLALRAPYLKLIGAVLLLLIAIELFAGEERHRKPASGQGASAGLWKAIMVIVVADAVMSMDNVVAVAAAAQDNFLYLVLGLVISIPILVSSSLLVARALDSFPLLVEAGAALLGWIAGKTAVADPAIAGMLDTQSFGLAALAPVLGAAYVIVQGRLLRARRTQSGAAPQFASLASAGTTAMAMPAPAATGESAPVARGVVVLGRRMSPMDLTIMAGVAVPLLGLVVMIIYMLTQAFASHH